MRLLDLFRQSGGTIGEKSFDEKVVAARKAVAEARDLVQLRNHPGWAVFQREVQGHVQKDKETLIKRMRENTIWKFLWDGDWRLAARVDGMERALKTLDDRIQSGIVAEQWLAESGPKT